MRTQQMSHVSVTKRQQQQQQRDKRVFVSRACEVHMWVLSSCVYNRSIVCKSITTMPAFVVCTAGAVCNIKTCVPLSATRNGSSKQEQRACVRECELPATARCACCGLQTIGSDRVCKAPTSACVPATAQTANEIKATTSVGWALVVYVRPAFAARRASCYPKRVCCSRKGASTGAVVC